MTKPGKRPNRRRPRPLQASPRPDLTPPKTSPRNSALDALRGLAVLLMLIDHVAAIWLEVPIAVDTVRLETRLAMPLFAMLLGYFLPVDGRLRVRRWGEILLACLAVNLLYYPRFNELEILASLLIAAITATLLRSAAVGLLGLFFFYQVDPLASWFDYQLTMVLPLVAVGVVLRRFGWRWAGAAAAVLLAIGLTGQIVYFTDTHRFLLWASPLAVILIELARRHPQWRPLGRLSTPMAGTGWMGLDWLGRHPLSIYVGHFYVLMMVAWVLGR